MSSDTVKWIATAGVIIAFAITAYGIYPLGPIIQIVASILWTIAGFMTRDRPLIVTNIFIIIVGVIALTLQLTSI